MKKYNLFALSAMMIAFVLCTTSCSLEDQEIVSQKDAARSFTIQPEKPDTVYTGVDDKPGTADLSQEWWKFVLGHDCNNNPLNYPNLQETEYQGGAVVFLVGSKNGVASRYIVARSNQTFFVPIFNTLQFEKCIRPALKPAIDESVENSLIEEADHFIDLVTNLKVVLDDNNIRITDDHRRASGVFTITAEKELSGCLDYCITGDEQKVASDGYWLTLKNLTPGWHELHTHGEILHTGLIEDVYYYILIQ
ncbi:MAG TPA: hypothetical protein VMZ69_01475 [Saprospiraceae bacterium]|nr:hypothetical protein [Saprospiraceae bacterium]